MGCNTSKQVAFEELSDIFEILKKENSALEEEKEALLKDQIDKPAEDKEIQQSIKKMTLELEETYRRAYELLKQLIASAEFQRDGSPSSRINQIHKLRFNLEEIYGKIESFHLRKKQLNHENDELRILIQNEKSKNNEIQTELQCYVEKKEVA
jgi:hypothetical protein